MRTSRRKTKYWEHRAGRISWEPPSRSHSPQGLPTQSRPGWGSGGRAGSGDGPTHQPQQAADLPHGADAAQEAHEHGDGPHADEDVGPHVEQTGGGLWGDRKKGVRPGLAGSHSWSTKLGAGSEGPGLLPNVLLGVGVLGQRPPPLCKEPASHPLWKLPGGASLNLC